MFIVSDIIKIFSFFYNYYTPYNSLLLNRQYKNNKRYIEKEKKILSLTNKNKINVKKKVNSQFIIINCNTYFHIFCDYSK